MAVRLRPVTKDDYRFLFQLLQEKEEYQNISHTKMPTWRQHVKFNNNKPYAKDYIIQDGLGSVGRVYVTRQNEVGIAILKKYQRYGYGASALHLIMKKYPKGLLANISPRNKTSMKFFSKYGFKPYQITYKHD